MQYLAWKLDYEPLEETNQEKWIYYTKGPQPSVFDVLDGVPYYKFYFGMPFWSDDFLWFFMTHIVSLMWSMAIYMWPLSIPFLPPPIATYFLMVLYTYDQTLFDY